jgi:hypothetical protein
MGHKVRNKKSICSMEEEEKKGVGEGGWENFKGRRYTKSTFNPLNAELNPICPLLALFRVHHILHVSR